ncbi:putative non-specific serine/threonine protein kinase [Helianthus anomalus]
MWKMEEKYKPSEELGAGNFGVARLAIDKITKELFTLKGGKGKEGKI